MADRDEQAVARFVERLALMMADSGIPRMPARVFACLMASADNQMTAAEVSETLQVSPAAVSGAVRYLTQVGLVERRREPGERRDHYVADESWVHVFTDRNRLLLSWADALGEGADLLAGTPAGDRLDTSRRFFLFLRKEMGALLERWSAEDSAFREAREAGREAPEHQP